MKLPMRKKDVENISNSLLPLIARRYGLSKYDDRYPIIVVSKGDRTSQGNYDHINCYINLFYSSLYSRRRVVQILLHEYKHYLQYQTWYTRYCRMGYNYEDHPYEIEANAFESEYVHFI